LPAGDYAVRTRWHGADTTARELLRIREGKRSSVQVAVAGGWLALQATSAGEQSQASGGERLSSRQVSELP